MYTYMQLCSMLESRFSLILSAFKLKSTLRKIFIIMISYAICNMSLCYLYYIHKHNIGIIFMYIYNIYIYLYIYV